MLGVTGGGGGVNDKEICMDFHQKRAGQVSIFYGTTHLQNFDSFTSLK